MSTTTTDGSSEASTLEALREITDSFREFGKSQAETDRLIQEIARGTDRRVQDTDRRVQETDRRIQETDRRIQEADRRSRETDRRFEKTERLMRELWRNADRGLEETKRLVREIAQNAERRTQETARRMRETDRRMRETDRRLKKAENLFTTQWGKLMETLVSGDLVKLLKERDVAVERLAQRTEHSRNGEHYELDILAVNGREVVAVEVKTTLRPEDVTRFRDKLQRFREWWPEYQDRRVYGAMAYLQGGKDVATHAERQGFFVIRATGSSSSIVNAKTFKPRVFG